MRTQLAIVLASLIYSHHYFIFPKSFPEITFILDASAVYNLSPFIVNATGSVAIFTACPKLNSIQKVMFDTREQMPY